MVKKKKIDNYTLYYTKKYPPTPENLPTPPPKKKWKKKKVKEIKQLEDAIEQIKLKQWFNK